MIAKAVLLAAIFLAGIYLAFLAAVEVSIWLLPLAIVGTGVLVGLLAWHFTVNEGEDTDGP